MNAGNAAEPVPSADPGGSLAVEAAGLTVHYRDLVALEDVALRLPYGQICGLVGINGSGKSTLMKALMGAVPLAGGNLQLCGLEGRAARRQGLVAYVPQHESVDWTFPILVRDVVRMGRHRPWFSRRDRRGDDTVVNTALARVGLSELADRQVGELSGGQRRRCFIARGLAQEAKLLLLDEPFAGVDRASEDTLTTLLHELAADGCAVLVSVHDLAAVPKLCSSVLLLRRKVVHFGSPDDVLRPELLASALGLNLAEAAKPAEDGLFGDES